MKSKIDSRNRVLLTVLALALIALGVVALCARYGVLALRQPGDLAAEVAGLPPPVPALLLATAVILGFVLALLGLGLLTGQVGQRGSKVGVITLHDRPGAQTTLRPEALGRALRRDLLTIDGVHAADARVLAAGPLPRIVVHARVDEERDLGAVRQEMEAAYTRLAGALGVEGVRTEVHLKPEGSQVPRVR